ncbi:MAG: ABC-F family ATP-binding cassette domain-containing protein [Flavobacteriales bacterium]|nr:ABC-F family ATP-binding cassette domain-containing protein [Flavobacteriales bacterium]
MNYLSAENLSRSYGERVLFKDLTFGIDRGQKMALVAKNGTGKTSLLRILAGLEPSEGSGTATYRNGISVGYLTQEPQLNPEHTVMDAVYDPTNQIMQVVREYELAMLDESDSERMQRSFDAMDRHNAWDIEAQAKEILTSLNITDFDQPIKTLSGGQVKRVAMAKMLIEQPELMILDEPTNHLDIEMIEWLEGFLSGPEKTILMVTHDRIFLDKVCDTIIELEGGQLYKHKGNYSTYLTNRALRQEVEHANVDKAQNLYRKELDWMRRQPKARTTKSKSRQDAFYETEKVAKTNLKQDEMTMEVNMQRMGSKILELHRLRKAYGDRVLMDGFDFKFRRGERIGIVGANGCGKSTLLKMILGQIEPDGGKIVIGETVKVGYYGQDGLEIKDGKRVIEVITDIADHIPLKKGKSISAAQLLERFLFPRHQHYQYVEKLSGGEKKRLYLLTVLMANPNFLILDEPTNDLDILSLNVLEDFLLEFEGCLLIVTHDRHFMNKLVDQLFIFEGNGKIRGFVGNYDQYRFAREEEEDQRKKQSANAKKAQKETEGLAAKGKMGFNEKREFGLLEVEIPKLEAKKVKLTEELEAIVDDHEKLMAVSEEFQRVSNELEEKELRWLELSELEG